MSSPAPESLLSSQTPKFNTDMDALIIICVHTDHCPERGRLFCVKPYNHTVAMHHNVAVNQRRMHKRVSLSLGCRDPSGHG